MSMTSQPLHPAARRLLAALFYLVLAATPGAAFGIEIKNFPGDHSCPAGWTPLTFADAVANKKAACGVLAQWDIARLAEGGSMDGPGYQCQIRGSDQRTLGNSLCAKRETLEAGKLKVCLYPGFAPFVGSDLKGWDVTFLKDFANQQGLTWEAVSIDKFDDIWTLPGQDRCDIAASGISDVAARRKQTGCVGDWSDHYYSVCRAFGVLTEHKELLKDIGDLKGKTVIVTGGSTADLDLANRMKQAGIARCSNGSVTSCVDVQTTDSEEKAAHKVQNKQAFAYGGGLGSIQYLAGQQGSGLAPVWAHCNMLSDYSQATEPFSFVVRHASTGLLEALNAYIAQPPVPYPGKPSCQTCPPPAP